jgi:hypothetical protein
MTTLFAAEHESADTTRTSRSLLRMSVHWGEAVMPTSLPEMTRMTRFGHSTPGAVSRSPSGDSDEIVLTHAL